jgi:arylsulfatase A-like enzyme
VAVALAMGAVLLRAPRPNVVLIIVDTLRADALGAYDPAAAGITPELDALAARGVRFSQVTAQCSWTRPSIGSLLTSRYPRTLGLYRESFDVLPDSAVTLAEVLRANGYETAGITANPNINSVFRFDQGFDRHVDSTVVWDFMPPGPGQRTRSRRARLLDSQTVLGEMLEHARARVAEGGRAPVYMQITLMDVHEGRWLVRPEFRQNDHGRFGLPRGYWDAVRQVSHDIGEFVRALESLPGWGDALFVITSDHGQGLDDHPDVDRSGYHGLLLYGSQIDVPLILYQSPPDDSYPLAGLLSRVRGQLPQLPRGAIETPVRLLDLAPTILDYVGVDPPADMEGRSLLRLVMEGGDLDPGLPGFFVSETRFRGADKIAARTPEWTYIENRDGHEGVNARELQPRGIRENGRLTDRIGDEPAIASELETLLRRWERNHLARPAEQPSEDVSQDELEQLRAMGYVE